MLNLTLSAVKKSEGCLGTFKKLISPAHWFFKPVTNEATALLSSEEMALALENRNYAFNNGLSKLAALVTMFITRHTSTILNSATSSEYCDAVVLYTLGQAFLDFKLAYDNQKRLSPTIGLRCC